MIKQVITEKFLRRETAGSRSYKGFDSNIPEVWDVIYKYSDANE